MLRFHRLLCAAFNQGRRWQLLDQNPAELATPPRAHRDEIEIPAIDDFRRVLDAAHNSRNPENALIFRILATTGCRRGELCGMRWSDVDLDAGTIRIRRAVVQVKGKLIENNTKGHQQRTVALDDVTVELLRHHHEEQRNSAAFFEVEPEPNGFVFSDLPTGATPLPPDRLTQAWTRLAEAERRRRPPARSPPPPHATNLGVLVRVSVPSVPLLFMRTSSDAKVRPTEHVLPPWVDAEEVGVLGHNTAHDATTGQRRSLASHRAPCRRPLAMVTC